MLTSMRRAMKNDSKKVESLSKKQLIEQVEGKKLRTSLTALTEVASAFPA